MAENKTTLADVVSYAGRESQVTMLGDADHSDIESALALTSPEVIQAAAKAGKKYIILEAWSAPYFEESFAKFAKGEVSEADVREWVKGLSSNMTSDKDVLRMQEAAVNTFVALKQNGMTLLSTGRDESGLLPTEAAHPEFVAYKEASEAARRGGEDALIQFEQKIIKEKGLPFIHSYNAWKSGEWQQQMNDRDYKVVNQTINRANGEGVLIVWGNDHNQLKDDLDEAIGADRTRVVSVYPNTRAPQITRDGVVFRQDKPEYVYYVEESIGGRPDVKLNISTAPQNVQAATQEQFNSINNNSLAGTLDPTFKFPHADHDAGQINVPSPVAAAVNKSAPSYKSPQ